MKFYYFMNGSCEAFKNIYKQILCSPLLPITQLPTWLIFVTYLAPVEHFTKLCG